MELDDVKRPKSAPAKSFRPAVGASRFVHRISLNRKLSVDTDNNNGDMTLAETVNRLHTTERMAQRLKERRRTEAEINVIEKPTLLLASEVGTKRISYTEMENVVARVTRPTASYSARVSSTRRINARDIYVPPPVMHVQYFDIEDHRFKGNRTISPRDLKSLVDRLSSYNPRRQPAESVTPEVKNLKRQLGPLSSYRWKGLRNC